MSGKSSRLLVIAALSIALAAPPWLPRVSTLTNSSLPPQSRRASALRPDVHGGPRPDLVQVALLPDPASRLPTPGAC